jgi:hypothetical protein
MISFQHVINKKMRHFTYLIFLYKVLDIWCAFYTHRISQFGPASYQVLAGWSQGPSGYGTR